MGGSHITNMAMRVVGKDGQLLPEIQQAQAAARAGGGGARGGGGGGGRGGSKSEPWMPWMPWSAAVYDYNSKNESKPTRKATASRPVVRG